MPRVAGLASSGEMDLNRFVQANNEGEFLLAQRDYPGAAKAFLMASRFLGPCTPTYMRDLVNAGIGICSLECGDLTEARRREGLLNDAPPWWYFDPSTLIAFRVRILERKGQAAQALSLLARAEGELKSRLPTAWLKIAVLHVQLLMKTAPHEARRLAQARSLDAASRGLTCRERQFRRLASINP